MKKYNSLLKNSICTLLAFLMLTFFCVINSNYENLNKSQASNAIPQNSPETTIDHSIFIHSPTYSVLYHKNIYFIDKYDSLLKIYDLNENKFSENYLNLSNLGQIIDVAYLNEYMFVLSLVTDSQELSLSIISLPEIKVSKTLSIDSVSNAYTKISICELNTDWLISLTPKVSTKPVEILPAILTLNKASLELTNTCIVNIVDDEISQTLFELMVIESSGTTSNDIYMTLVYDGEISFFGSELESVTTSNSISINNDNRSLLGNLDTSNTNITYAAINQITVNGELLFVVTYNETQTVDDALETSAYSRLYKFAIDVSDDKQFFESKLSIQTASNDYVMVSNGCVIYPLTSKQQIAYTAISYDEQNEKYVDNTASPISNPNIDVEYKNENQFEFVTANKKTVLLSTPWEPEENSTCEIDPTESSKDLIVIGYGKIAGENNIISDYKYCLYTTGDKNIKGFVKTEDLTSKDKISNEDYGYQVFKVQPNTNLYSLPTTIINDNVTPTLTSNVVSIIKDNSRVEIIDAICNYKSNEKIMLKVKVNDNEVGYIEYDKIIKPSEEVEFVITNASIKDDNTLIYLESNSSSPIICILDKGYRVRIDGSRDTKSGYTKVTFNDEYGNEFTGYILTDSLGSDSWTVMQIIGCILIAINIGLLILILRFKKNNIGVNGSKFIDTENKSFAENKNNITKNANNQ